MTNKADPSQATSKVRNHDGHEEHDGSSLGLALSDSYGRRVLRARRGAILLRLQPFRDFANRLWTTATPRPKTLGSVLVVGLAPCEADVTGNTGEIPGRPRRCDRATHAEPLLQSHYSFCKDRVRRQGPASPGVRRPTNTWHRIGFEGKPPSLWFLIAVSSRLPAPIGEGPCPALRLAMRVVTPPL